MVLVDIGGLPLVSKGVLDVGFNSGVAPQHAMALSSMVVSTTTRTKRQRSSSSLKFGEKSVTVACSPQFEFEYNVNGHKTSADIGTMTW